MSKSTIFQALVAVALSAVLSACVSGGVGSGGSDQAGPGNTSQDDTSTVMPIRNMTSAEYQQLQERGIIALNGEEQTFSSLATTVECNGGMTAVCDYVGRRAGTITFESGSDAESTSIRVAVEGTDTPASGNFNSSDTETGTEVIGNGTGEQITYQANSTNETQRIVYVPRQDSNLYVAGYLEHTNANNAGIHGVFGRETTESEMTQILQLAGSATYQGAAFASVATLGTATVESGLYEGATSATVNFDTNGFDTSSTLIRRDTTNPGPRDRFSFSMSGTFGDNGDISANGNIEIKVGERERLVPGEIEGSFYGPDGKSIGTTFTGVEGHHEASKVEVVGHQAMTLTNRVYPGP